jgi:succinate dehydrogenase / fumarate reductase flavoprotein subunit
MSVLTGIGNEVRKSDVLVVGGGLAGSFAAIKAREAGAETVTLISKGLLGKDSISTFAAGVWIAFMPEDDKEELMKTFTLDDVHGAGLYDEEWLGVFLHDNYERLMELDRWGVEWEKTPDGNFERKACRWNLKQCMFHGPQLMEAVTRKVTERGVDVVGHTMVTDLLTKGGKEEAPVIGAVGFDVRAGTLKVFKAKSVVVASGGCGYKARFACHKMDTGDGVAMAYRAGAVLGRFDEGKLHTTCTDFDTHGLNMFVGLGGRFVNARGEQFMLEYDPVLGNRAGMTTLSEAAAMEVRGGRGPIYLDMTHFTGKDVRKLRTVLPIPTKIMERAGVMVGNRIVQKMEWAPAYYGTIGMSGGIMANTKCETSLPGLFASGDAMARAKPTAALPMAAVSGARSGTFAAEFAKEIGWNEIDEGQFTRLRDFVFAPQEKPNGIEPDHIIIGLHEALLPYGVTVIARGDRLMKALSEIERIRDEELPFLYASDPHDLRLANETRNMVLCAEIYLRSRLTRKESRDSSVREDYPYTDNIDWLKTILAKQRDGKMAIWTEDLPVDRYRVKPKRERYLYPVLEVATKRGIPWG